MPIPRTAPARRPVSPGQVVDLEVSAMALDGDALGTVGGYVLLAAGTLPGERVRARVTAAGKKSGRAEVLEVLRPSPHRVLPACKHFGPCGGCAWQHIAYPEQLRLKREMLAAALGRASAVDASRVRETLGLEVESGAAAGAPWGFRNKVHFVLGRGRGAEPLVMGHHARGSREIIPVKECPVHASRGNLLAFRLRELLVKYGIPGADERRPAVRSRPERTPADAARHVIVRVGEKSGRAQVTLVATGEKLQGIRQFVRELSGSPQAPEGIHLNINDKPGPFILGRRTRTLHGEDRLLEEVAGARFVVSPRSFFQTCVRSAEKLVGVVLEFIPAEDRRPILDLYSGTGLFSLALARRGHEVVGVEENPASVRDAALSRKWTGIQERACRFIQGRVEDVLGELCGDPDDSPPEFGTVLLDPPREGCPPRALAFILAKLRPCRIVYVSCNPRALAGDLSSARRAGYVVAAVQPIDMFPHTAHIESVALVERLREPGAGKS